MIREVRYLVVKYKDIAKYLSDKDAIALSELVKKINAGRRSSGKQVLECVCVESDWPEYQEVWTMIAARVDDVCMHKARIQQCMDYGSDVRTPDAASVAEGEKP